jgi:hypothetical protein
MLLHIIYLHLMECTVYGKVFQINLLGLVSCERPHLCMLNTFLINNEVRVDLCLKGRYSFVSDIRAPWRIL